METSIMKIHKKGLEISLMDSSMWRLNNVGDVTKTTLWYPTQRVRIEETEGERYTLTNLDTFASDKIDVSRIY